MTMIDSKLKNKAGFKEADLYLNTQYMPENDPKILAAIEEYKKSEA